MATPPNPVQTTPMMQQAQTAMNNPMGAPVNPGGGIDPSVHPIVGQIVRALQAAATGYGWTAMSPQEREQRTALQQQKAEALGRQAIAQQQLGLEAQRTGAEVGLKGTQQKEIEARLPTIGPQAQAEIERSKAATAQSQAETAAIPQRTATEAARAKTEQQRADQEYETKNKELKQQADQLEENIRYHKQQGSLDAQRNSILAQEADTASDRVQNEETHYNQQMQIQGQQLTRQEIDNQRKQTHQVLDDYYKEHPILQFLKGKDAIVTMHNGIDAYYDEKLKQGADVGTAKPIGTGTQPPATKPGGDLYYNPDGTRAAAPVTRQDQR